MLIDLDILLFPISVQSKNKVTTNLARITVNKFLYQLP